MSVLVSINCITYNQENYIADALESFLMQKTNFKFEIIIGEDCSTDDTKEIIEAYQEKYPDIIRIISSDRNIGAIPNSHRVFRESRGKYIAECEGDDFWIDPYKLQKQVDYLEENKGCTMCFHAAEVVLSPKKFTGRKIKSYNKSGISSMEDIISGGGGFCPTASLVYPRKILENPPAFLYTAHVGDYPLQLYLASQGYAYYMADCMGAYRTGVKGSWTSSLIDSRDIKRKMVEVNKGDIHILEAFNKHTKFKYDKSVKKSIMEKEFAISIIIGKRQEPKSNFNKEPINNISLKKKSKIILLTNFPKTYIKLAEVKNFVFNTKLFN